MSEPFLHTEEDDGGNIPTNGSRRKVAYMTAAVRKGKSMRAALNGKKGITKTTAGSEPIGDGRNKRDKNSPHRVGFDKLLRVRREESGRFVKCEGEQKGTIMPYLVYWQLTKGIRSMMNLETNQAQENGMINDALGRLAQVIASGAGEGVGWPQKLEEMAYVEIFITECLSSSAQAEVTRQYMNNENEVQFLPPTTQQIVALIDHTVLPTSQFSLDNNGTQIFGRGLGYASLRRVLSGVRNLCKYGALTDNIADAAFLCPTTHTLVQMKLKSVEALYDPKGAPSFSITDVPYFYQAVFNNPHNTNSYLSKVRTWSLFCFTFSFFSRPSEVSRYCPDMRLVRLPKDPKHYFKNGMPKRLYIGLTDQKTSHVLTYMVLHANSIGAMFCPVYWMFKWLTLSGIGFESQGPIYRPIRKGVVQVANIMKEEATSNGVDHIWYARTWNEDGGYNDESLHLGYDTIANDLAQVWSLAAEQFKRYQFHLLTLYSIRKSGPKWGARCLANESDLRRNMRHTSHTSNFSLYIEEGCRERNEALGDDDNREDPAFYLWCYKPAAVANIDIDVEDVIEEFRDYHVE